MRAAVRQAGCLSVRFRVASWRSVRVSGDEIVSPRLVIAANCATLKPEFVQRPRAAIRISALAPLAGLSPCAGHAACARARSHPRHRPHNWLLTGPRRFPAPYLPRRWRLASGWPKKHVVRLLPNVTPLRPSIPRLALFCATAAEHSTPAAWNRAFRAVRIFRACGRTAQRFDFVKKSATQSQRGIPVVCEPTVAYRSGRPTNSCL